VWVKLLMEIHWLERKSRLVPAHCKDMDKLQNNWNRPQKIQSWSTSTKFIGPLTRIIILSVKKLNSIWINYKKNLIHNHKYNHLENYKPKKKFKIQVFKIQNLWNL
jgi:hypothetical protein